MSNALWAGFQLGQHRLLGDKRHQYENDIRIPFIMRGKSRVDMFGLDYL
jgi:hypothetical protein